MDLSPLNISFVNVLVPAMKHFSDLINFSGIDECWDVKSANPEERLHFTFTAFDMEGGTTCSLDYLQITTGRLRQ